MHVFDASSMIYAWDNYPLQQFPPLWKWMAEQIVRNDLVMSSIALEEVAHKTPECSDWLKEHNLQKVDVANAIIQEAARIKAQLGIVGDSYHPKGVDENDLIIIATAVVCGGALVSDESKQKLPDLLSKRKIPAVCVMPGVNVECMSFIEYIKRSAAVFV